MKRPFTIYDLRFTICGKSAKSAIVTPNSELRTPNSQKGVALIITLILLAVVTFMALTFLAVSRRERGAVTTTTDTTSARLAADAALAAAEGEIVANTLAATNPYNFGLLVSTNYLRTNSSPLPDDLTNLFINPRTPVWLSNTVTRAMENRFYLDLNRNGEDDPNGWVTNVDNTGAIITDGSGNPSTNIVVGDPEWIGVLQHPDQPYGPNNPFVARYAYIALPIGNTLDLNAIYNEAFTRQVDSSLGTVSDGFLRNQGVGSWELNLAAFLADLNTNSWNSTLSGGVYAYLEANTPNFPNTGAAFDDALSLLSCRYGYNYNSLAPVGGTIPNGLFTTANTFGPFQNNIDGYSDGPLMTGFAGINESGQDVTLRWSGADNTNQFFDLQELFNTNETAVGVAPAQVAAGNDFTGRLLNAGGGFSTYDRYTYYRLASQLGVESAPEQDKMNLNYDNLDPGSNGVLTANGTASATNFVPWQPLTFFTNAADRMLRDYSQEWLVENPSNYVATFNLTTNIGTLAVPTNMPVPFGISSIPVWVSNQFVYTPAVQRVLQLAANIYDATTNNANGTTPDYPSVFRPIFNVAPVLSPVGEIVYTNVYIAGYEPVGYGGQIGAVPGGTNNYQLALPVSVADLLTFNPNSPAPPYPSPFGIYTNVNVYGVPWIIGAKKGYPNFNEFAMESAFQLTRKLQVTRQNTNDTYVNNPGDYSYNQMFNLSLTNQLAVECWNSYSNFYQYPAGQPRSVAMYVEDTLSVTLTNDEYPFSYTTNFLITGSLQIPNPGLTAWPGYSPLIIPSPSFQIPLNVNIPVIPTSMYRFNSGAPFLTTNLELPFEIGATFNGQLYPQPHWWLMTTNNVQVIILDTTVPNSPQVIDYVQLSGPDGVRDLSYEIMTNYDVPFNTTEASGSELWNTNIQNGVPIGIVSQIAVSDGNATASSASGTWDTTDPTQLANEIAGFTAFMGYTPTPPLTAGESSAIALAQTSLSNNAPYQPVATMIQVADWQVNDPLVHYLAEDIDQPGIEPSFRPPIPPAPMPTLTNSANATIGYLNNQRYMPWGISVPAPSGIDSSPYNLAFKDPLVRQSDDWDFPTYKLPTVGWLGRVHRGTPWQTVYLKSPDILREIQIQIIGGVTTTNSPNMGTNTWVWWTGNTSQSGSANFYDAANMAPVQDRVLFDNFTTAFDDNATHGQLSVNVGASDPNNPQAGLAAWSALFSGVQVLFNNAADRTINPAIPANAQHNGSLENFTSFPISPAGPAGTNAAVGEIVTAVNQTRANANNTVWVSSLQVLTGGITNAIEIPATFANADGLTNVFEHVGDILAVPQLSVQSPFLNWNNSVSLPNGVTYQQANGISDEMYDWLPQQVMSLLRVSGTPQSPMRYVIYSYGQALKPAPNGIYTGSGPLFGMITNYQVVAESATRSVLQFNGTRVNNPYQFTNAVIGDLIWTNVPSITNNNVLIERFNVLPPN